MNRHILLVLLATGASCSLAQTPIITSFQENGRISWNSQDITNAIYRIEWASEAAGPWFQTFDALHSIDSLSRTSFSAQVPMFYRVVMTTSAPPEGMVLIDAGDVALGAEDDGPEEPVTPIHTNYISAFYMDEMEVTKALWDEVYVWATNNGYTFANPGLGKESNHPVHSITWHDSVKWCNARSEKNDLTPCYYTSFSPDIVYRTGTNDIGNDLVKWDANGYRLPTEAEWEKAARGSRQQHLFPLGNEISHSQANYYSQTNYPDPPDISPTSGYHPTYSNGVTPYTSPVGSFPANGFGLHDMAGNISEMCWDWWDLYSSDYQTDPHGPLTNLWPSVGKVVRGGSWKTSAYVLRTYYRGEWINNFSFVWNSRGFRCVRSAGSL